MQTTADYDAEILLADTTTWRGFMLARKRDKDGNVIDGQAPTISELLESSEADQQIQRRLVPVVQKDWSRGFGLDYVDAAGVYTRTPDYALPAGLGTDITGEIPVSGNSNSPIVKIEEFAGSLFLAQEGVGGAGGRVIASAGGAALANSVTLTPGDIVRDLCIFDDGAGGQRLYVSYTTASGTNGQLRRWDGSSWAASSGAVFGAGRSRMVRVNWRTPDANVGWRLVTISGPNTLAYTIPDADPYLAASWVEGVKIVSGGHLVDLVAARKHVWVTATDGGLYDLDETGNAPNLVGDISRVVVSGLPLPALYLDGYVHLSLGQQLDRVYVGDSGVLQENPGMCSPGWGTRAESEWRGIVTAMTSDQGYVVAAVLNPTTGKTGIFWGKDRNVLGIDSPNPMIWYGPEVVIEAAAGRVTAMRTTAFAGDLRLYVASWIAGSTPVLSRISIPIAGAPLQDLLSGGLHRFNPGDGYLTAQRIQPYARLQLLPIDTEDRVAPNILHQHAVASRGLSVVTDTRIFLEVRADAEPGALNWTTTDVATTSPIHSFTPSVVVKGNRIERRISFFSPDGDATPPKVGVLDAVRTTLWKVAASARNLTLDVEYGPGVTNRRGVDESRDQTRDPDVITADILALGEVGRTTIRLPNGKRWTLKVHQSYASEVEWHDAPFGQTRTARIDAAIIAGPL